MATSKNIARRPPGGRKADKPKLKKTNQKDVSHINAKILQEGYLIQRTRLINKKYTYPSSKDYNKAIKHRLIHQK